MRRTAGQTIVQPRARRAAFRFIRGAMPTRLNAKSDPRFEFAVVGRSPTELVRRICLKLIEFGIQLLFSFLNLELSR